MKSIHDLAAYAGRNRYNTHFENLDVKRQLTVLLDTLGRDHLIRVKQTGSGTKKARAYICHLAIEQLKAAGYGIKNLARLGDKHIAGLLEIWSKQGLSASTLATRISILRWLAAALGKRGLVRDPCSYGFVKGAMHRPQVSTRDKSWTGAGVDARSKLEQIAKDDPWVAMALELGWAFGLRITEAILLQPQAAHTGDVLRIEHGTKGGRTRLVPVRNQQQTDLLERAKLMSQRSDRGDYRGNLIPPRSNPGKARRRIYYIAAKHGISKAQLGTTPHGLRHEYAQDRYAEESGTQSSLRGGSAPLAAEIEAAARRSVSNELGHSRTGITGSYLGAPKAPAAAVPVVPTPPTAPSSLADWMSALRPTSMNDSMGVSSNDPDEGEAEGQQTPLSAR